VRELQPDFPGAAEHIAKVRELMERHENEKGSDVNAAGKSR
jgi:hypothetical protein